MRNLMEFGAVPDGKTLCTDAFARAIAACKQSGETLLVPAGRYYTGTINLDGVSMHFKGGARIIGSSDPKDYPPLDYVHSEMGTLRALIVSLHGENMVLDGDGVINLKGSSFYDFDRPIVPETRVPMTPEEIACCTVEHDWRPTQSIFFANIKGLTVRNLSILDAPCWTVSVNSCENVVLSDLYINTSLRIPNDDGIHICGCNGVLISDCRISSGDDCIALSSITDWNRPCENIVIKNCKLHSCSKAIVIGYHIPSTPRRPRIRWKFPRAAPCIRSAQTLRWKTSRRPIIAAARPRSFRKNDRQPGFLKNRTFYGKSAKTPIDARILPGISCFIRKKDVKFTRVCYTVSAYKGWEMLRWKLYPEQA